MTFASETCALIEERDDYDCREHGLWPTSDDREMAFGPARVSPPDRRPVRQLGAAGADQTDQNIREHNARLIAEVARLTEAIEARDAFLAVAAHELRNPMTPIIGRIQILARAVRRPDFQVERLVQGLDEIEWLITRYLKRANVLLDVSRITSGKLALERLPVDVCEVAREVIENFSPLRRHAGSDLTLDLPGEPVVVSGDRLAIEEILDNLVSNAIKYGADKPILLRIGVDEEQHCAVIRVSDTGSGISADDQARNLRALRARCPAGRAPARLRGRTVDCSATLSGNGRFCARG